MSTAKRFGGPVSILVVEDERAVADLIEMVLGRDGHQCLVAKSTGEADLVLETVPVDVMTLDLGLPDSDALAWLEELRLLRPELAESTVVITGSLPSDQDESRIAECGAELLLKPFTFDELTAAVKRRAQSPPARPRKPPTAAP